MSASVLLITALLGTEAQCEQRSEPWREPACNDACKWWMNLGAKPVAETRPPPEPDPTLSIKALAPPNMSLTSKDASQASAGGPVASPKRDSPVGRTRTAVITVLPPVRPDDIVGASLWGVRIHGSAPVLPAAFLQPH